MSLKLVPVTRTGEESLHVNYSGTPLYEHPLNTDTLILRTVPFAPINQKLIYLLKLTRLIRTPDNTDTSANPLGVRINRVPLYPFS